ncbi:teichoic acid biosynthesis protein C [Kribbella capetownensis]|uniref:Teichoic acid biosynthesis protein C n=1 Tax=Kribbella capetownensis TaxID=1572659 RepID=A0A4V2M8S6_9ACTN|nr:teichoic acid biosynthesis protein C [Kribbella capetownensis]TCC52612.1 teichoic acid biosynthesis protein C [Kribbella capetownensis]
MDNLSRRGLLAGAGAMLVAGAVGSPAAAHTPSLPWSRRFALDGPGGELFRSKPLADVTVMQSIAFDNVNQRLFAGQLRSKTASNSGDLTLTRLSVGGDVVGHMYLSGFGHAVSIGAEAVGRTTYLWTETDVDPANARGRQIARFRWQDGATLTKDSPGLRSWKPVADGAVFTPSVDQRHGQIGIRHTLSDGFHINVYSLLAARAGNFSRPIASFKQPAMTEGIDFQGWALYGSYVYLWEGEAYSGAPDPALFTSKLWCFDINSGQVVESTRILDGADLVYREAEGVGVHVDRLGRPRLCFGFASGVTGDRRANLFYRDTLV